MPSLKEIQEFIEKISKLNIERVEVKTDDFKLILEKKKENINIQETPIITNPKYEEKQVQELTVIESKKVQKEEKEVVSLDLDNRIIIKSSMVGTFYRKPKPDQPSFVEVGSKIKQGDIICIIEAMKLFNEIESEYSGEIIKIFLEEGSPVEYDQPLFEILSL